MTQLVVCGGGRAGRGVGGGATGSSQCWSVGQPVHSSLLPPTMAAAGIPVSAPSTLPNSVDIQQRIESALSSVPELQASNVTVKVCVITSNHGTVNF
jgi:hypothetical protein